MWFSWWPTWSRSESESRSQTHSPGLSRSLGCFKVTRLDLQLELQLNPNSNPNLTRVGVQVGVSCLNAIYFDLNSHLNFASRTRVHHTNDIIYICINNFCPLNVGGTFAFGSISVDVTVVFWFCATFPWHGRVCGSQEEKSHAQGRPLLLIYINFNLIQRVGALSCGIELGQVVNRAHEVDFKSPTWNLNFDLNFTKFPNSEVGKCEVEALSYRSWGRVVVRVEGRVG
jgi:hypothetical protein